MDVERGSSKCDAEGQTVKCAQGRKRNREKIKRKTRLGRWSTVPDGVYCGRDWSLGDRSEREGMELGVWVRSAAGVKYVIRLSFLVGVSGGDDGGAAVKTTARRVDDDEEREDDDGGRREEMRWLGREHC